MEFEEEKQRLKKLLKRHVKASKKYIVKCKDLLAKAISWQKEQHLAELLSANQYLIKKGMREIHVLDWNHDNQEITISLDPSVKPSEEIAHRFKTSKKLRLSQEPLKKQLLHAEATKCHKEEQFLALEMIETEEALLHFKEKYKLMLQHPRSKKNVEPPPLPYYEFISDSKIPIWVGKSAKNNDLMTFKHANGNDYWLHISEYAGSHIIIHAGKKEIDADTLQDALQLALFYSKGKESGKAEIIVTQKKYVSKIGSKAGKVQVSTQKTILVTADRERIQKIKERKQV